ncbi:MAG: transglutaminase-like cysteine peptidase [Campylobacteraceae bacterium]|nr:transglutaminase-like cysteine peptidase [Campylobacteraceae bacterium]
MKQLILSLILLFNVLEANRLSFTKKDVETIKHLPQKKAALKRILMYNELKEKIKDYSTIRKLSHINAFYNKIMPVLDQTQYKIGDHWATRKEFLIQGKGDCEDYVIAKYFSLIELGIPKKKLYLSVVKVKGAKTDHMVLLYLQHKKAIPLVMDNLSFKVVPLTIRKKLSPKFAFNESASYLLSNESFGKKVRINWKGNNKWEELLTRVYDKHE